MTPRIQSNFWLGSAQLPALGAMTSVPPDLHHHQSPSPLIADNPANYTVLVRSAIDHTLNS